MFRISLIILLLANTYDSCAQTHASGDLTTEKDMLKYSSYKPVLTRGINVDTYAYSIKKYAPEIGNQGDYNTCVAWATAYAAKSICYNHKLQLIDSNIKKCYSFSPTFLYYTMKNNICDSGSSLDKAIDKLQSSGVIFNYKNDIDCYKNITIDDKILAQQHRIKTVEKIDNNIIPNLKNCLQRSLPVVITMKYFKSLDKIRNGLWIPDAKITDTTKVHSHAMCIVGYNDSLYGGAFEVMNSWGTDWGNNGFAWIRYNDFMKYRVKSYAVVDDDSEVDTVKNLIRFLTVLDNSPVSVYRDKQERYYLKYYMRRTNEPYNISVRTNTPVYIYILTNNSNDSVVSVFPNMSEGQSAVFSEVTEDLPVMYSLKQNINDDNGDVVILISYVDINIRSLINRKNRDGLTLIQAVTHEVSQKINYKHIKVEDNSADINIASLLKGNEAIIIDIGKR